MPTNTPNQGIPIQNGVDAANLPGAQTSEIGVVENRLVQRYTDGTDRAIRNAPSENQVSALTSEDRLEVFDSANWISLYNRSVFQSVRRTSDAAAINNSTGLVSDGTLVTTFPAVTGVYRWEDTILYSSSQVADYKVAYLFTAGTVWWGGIGLATAAAGTTGDGQWAITTASGTSAAYGGAAVGTKLLLKVWGEIILSGTGTNLTLQYSQNSLDATNTVPAYAGTSRVVWRMS